MRKLRQYNVFLKHRGPDLKNTFVSHLNKALCRAGCHPFLDAKSLVKGQRAFHSINEALAGCLCMLQYSLQAFHKHLKKGREEDVIRWKGALMQAAAITGFKLVDSGNDTAKLEEEIVAAVLNCLPSTPLPVVARHPVGLKELSAHVINILHKMGENVGVVGICGMSGIGKATLAREIFNQEYSNFDNRYFLMDVKEPKGFAILDLQMKMVADLLQVDTKKKNWGSIHWFDTIRNQKVFLVIDNISERKQFYELIPDLEYLGPGSRVLITSREGGVLKNIILDAPESVFYQMPGLSIFDSLDLFIWCAFRKNDINAVDASFHSFANEIAMACGGLPLALEVMGGFLTD